MIILGLDPGIATLGYGVIESIGNSNKVIDFGIIETHSKTSFPRRLVQVNEGIVDLLKKYKPDCVAMEELFFSKNVKTGINVAHARGVALCEVAKVMDEVYEYTPLQIKQAVVGYGRAEKMQVQQMVKVLLNLKEIPKPDDAADALAVAICHSNTKNMQSAFKIK